MNGQQVFLPALGTFDLSEILEVLSWSRLSEQILRVDKQSVCRGWAAKRNDS
jgi:hypothetical protein